MRAGLAVAVALGGLGWLGTCTNHVTPPAAPETPALVFVLDHGYHTSLVLSTPDGGLVRYAYGDWHFYAERQTGPEHAIAALLWSTPGALGRRQLPGPPEYDAVREQVLVGIDAVYQITVEQARIEALRASLDSIVAAAERSLETPEADLVFVPHPVDYHLRHNSNTVVGLWLEALGCERNRRPIFARWRIEDAIGGVAPGAKAKNPRKKTRRKRPRR
jgi:hypothetical protein